MCHKDFIEQFRKEKITRKELLLIKKNIKRNKPLSEMDNVMLELIKVKLFDKKIDKNWRMLKKRILKNGYYEYGNPHEGFVYYDV